MPQLNLDQDEASFLVSSSDDYRVITLTLDRDHTITTGEFIDELKKFIAHVEDNDIDFHDFDFESFLN